MTEQLQLKILSAYWLSLTGGRRRARDALGLNVKGKEKAWYRLRDGMDILESIPSDCKYEVIQKIPKALQEFIPVRLKDYDISL